MIKSDELRRFYEINWKIKGVIAVFNQIKLEFSKIWSGIPYISRKKLGLERVNNTFENIHQLVRDIIGDLNNLCYQYNKIYKSVVVNLQNAGVFINNQWTEDMLKIRVEEANTTSNTANEIIKNIGVALNVNSNIEKGIDNPNIIDLFAINKSRVKVAESIILECKKYFNTILNTALEANDYANNETSQLIREIVNQVNYNFDNLNNLMPTLIGYFDELTNDVIQALKNAFIEVQEKSDREQEINEVIGYYDVSEIYRMLRGALKADDAFAKLLDNQRNKTKPFNELLDEGNDQNNPSNSNNENDEANKEQTVEPIIVEK